MTDEEIAEKEEIDAISMLLERNYGFDQWGQLSAYKTDSWNLVDGVDHPYLVSYDPRGSFNHTSAEYNEWAFKTAEEAAKFFIMKKKELLLD